MYYEKRIEMLYVKSFLKANPGKFQFMILRDKTCYKHILKINSTCVQSSDDVTLLGVMIDKNLTFKKHIDSLVRKAQYKLHALQRIRKFLTIEKAKILGNAFIDSQFNYASLIWMFCRKTLYSKIEKIHHRTLRELRNRILRTSLVWSLFGLIRLYVVLHFSTSSFRKLVFPLSVLSLNQDIKTCVMMPCNFDM